MDNQKVDAIQKEIKEESRLVGICTYCKEVITNNLTYLHREDVGLFHVPECFKKWEEEQKKIEKIDGVGEGTK